MKNSVIVILLAFGMFGYLYAAEDKVSSVEAALQAAQTSLKLIDEGQYAESWQQAADTFKEKITEAQFSSSLKAVRTPLGKVKSRKVLAKQYTTNLPGAPTGEYVVIQFQTSYENKPSAIETFTPVLNKDGKWRMAGYYIR
jgi:hypothetical protein